MKGPATLSLRRSDGSFKVLKRSKAFVLTMAAGSLAGAWIGGMLLPDVPTATLLPVLAAIVLISAVNVWRHA